VAATLDDLIDAQADARRWERRVQVAEGRVADREQELRYAEDALAAAKQLVAEARADLATRRKCAARWHGRADRMRARLKRRNRPTSPPG
jgi:hypothetical protein